MSAEDTIQKLVQMKKDYDEAVEKNGLDLMAELFRGFFEAHPDVLGVRWTQYTPYFNDGDACVFRSQIDYAKLLMKKEENAEKSEEDEEDDDGYSEPRYGSELAESIKKSFAKIPDDIMEAVYGDHVQVTATREGFDVQEYEHD